MLDYLDYGASLGLFIYLFSKDALNWSKLYIILWYHDFHKILHSITVLTISNRNKFFIEYHRNKLHYK